MLIILPQELQQEDSSMPECEATYLLLMLLIERWDYGLFVAVQPDIWLLQLDNQIIVL